MQRALIFLAIGLMVSSCYNDKSKRHIEYSPNMYNSLPLEPYKQMVWSEANPGGDYVATANEKGAYVSIFENGLAAQKAPEGTVPRSGMSWYSPEDYTPYPYEANIDDYEAAGVEWFSPLSNVDTNAEGINCSEETFARGEELYKTFCIMCHGPNGQGNGILVEKGVYAGVPSYSGPTLVNLPEGKMFHTLTYGKGIMGSYASQLTPRQRWEVICYIQKFQASGS
ncbi:MAG: cytochrome c [Bacteroidota bacterium]